MSRSDSSFIPGMRKGTELTVLALLVGLLMTLQFVLPAAVFAFPGRSAASSPPSDKAFALAEVSVVRLVVSYTTPQLSSASPSSPQGAPTPFPSTVQNKATSSPIQCTGLGILVGSWKEADGSYVNWVLTEGALLSKSTPVCASNTTEALVGIDVYANNAYTGASTPRSMQPLGSLQCSTDPTLCLSKFSNAASLPGGAKLFFFSSSLPQPFVDVATQDVQPHLAIKLTDAGQKVPAPLVSASIPIEDFLDPMVGPLSLPPAGVPTILGPTERGTPIVNTEGQVVSIQLGPNTNLLPVVAAKAILQSQPDAQPANLLQTAWNNGIDDLYHKPANDAAAAAEFQAAAKLNAAFVAATAFMGFAVANGNLTPRGIQPTPAGEANPGTLAIFGSAVPRLWLWFGAALIVLLVVLVLGVVALRRSRAHRRELARYEADEAAARRIVEMKSQQRQQAPQTSPVVNKTSTPRPMRVPEPHSVPAVQPIAQPLAPQSRQALPIQQAAAAVVKEPGVTASAQTASDLRCPNCQRFVRADATYCPNCRYQLSSLTSHLQSQAIVAPASVSHGSGPSAETPVPQSQAALVEATPGNPAIEARLRRLWSQPG